jgi:hypothetical protein
MRMLPAIKLGEKLCLLDARLKEFRIAKYPSNVKTFKEFRDIIIHNIGLNSDGSGSIRYKLFLPLNAYVLLYCHVLNIEINERSNMLHAKIPLILQVAYTKTEINKRIKHL